RHEPVRTQVRADQQPRTARRSKPYDYELPPQRVAIWQPYRDGHQERGKRPPQCHPARRHDPGGGGATVRARMVRPGWLLRPLDRRLDLLHQEVRNAQQMAARAYEAVQDWPGRLEQIRASADYEAAYTEEEPLITVRIATYNRADTLVRRAVPS